MAALRKLKGFWLLATFALGGLFWARDMWVTLQAIPATVAAHAERIEALEAQDCWPPMVPRRAGL